MSEPFAVSVLVARIPAGGKHVHVEADEAQRNAVAQALDILGVETLAADLRVVPTGRESFAVRGKVTASVTQTDVVTLEPLRQEVAEEIDLVLAPASEGPSARRGGGEPSEEESAEEQDVYRNGRIDLGAIVLEHLALGLDPYPRASSEPFPGHSEDETGTPSPFAALADLKRDRD